jgi:hypothetical protein
VLVAVALAASSTAAAALPSAAAPRVGNDVSWPQCGQAYPVALSFGIVGVNDGRPNTANPCLASEYQWARASGVVELYMNIANPSTAVANAYDAGYAAARYAFQYANAQVGNAKGHAWWIDVETGNSWSTNPTANTDVIAGSIAFFRAKGVTVGIYSTVYQWGVITGGAIIPSVPNWVPGAQSAAQAPSFCAASHSFSGGPVVLAQYTTQFDNDVVCAGESLPAAGSAAVAPPGLSLQNLLDGIGSWLNSL